MPPPDEDAFRLRRQAALDHPCPFERALLARCAACSRARTVLLAEREAIGCDAQAASERCHDFRDRLRAASRFALRADPSAPWPFSKEIRLQCGGLIGLAVALDEDEALDEGEALDDSEAPDDGAAATDADALIQRALQRFRDLDTLPWSRIIRAVIRHEPRRRAPR
ncbi:MAG: hypothetical protein ABS56_00290 [Lautropia sp. SCN 69-89]|nr:MAG: hypothetical protein ABS56_00290 [Lautropia sp. SCN 69-89]